MFCSAVAGLIRCWVDVPPIKWAHCNETALGTWTRPMHGRQRVCVCVGGSGNNMKSPWLEGTGYLGFGSVLHLHMLKLDHGKMIRSFATQAHLYFYELLTAHLRWDLAQIYMSTLHFYVFVTVCIFMLESICMWFIVPLPLCRRGATFLFRVHTAGGEKIAWKNKQHGKTTIMRYSQDTAVSHMYCRYQCAESCKHTRTRANAQCRSTYIFQLNSEIIQHFLKFE